jgi:hypothetical protein
MSSEDPAVLDSTSPQDGLAARAAALNLVEAALDHRGGLEEALDRAPFSDLELRDRALARMLAMTMLRRVGAIDQMLATKLQKPPPMAVMMLLRLGLAQALYMETPAFAAVDTTVSLAEQTEATKPFKGLINAVLRGLLREPAPEPDAEAYLPGWLFSRWSAAYGEANARAIAGMILEEPATDLTLRDPAQAGALAEAIGAAVLPGGSLRVNHRGDVTAWPGYVEGQWWVQDAAAAIPARLAGLRPDETAIDLCSAPGGQRAGTDRADRRGGPGGRRRLERRAPVRRGAAGCALFGDRHLSPPSRRDLGHAPARHRQAGGGAGKTAEGGGGPRRAGRAADLLRLLAGARRGRGPGR